MVIFGSSNFKSSSVSRETRPLVSIFVPSKADDLASLAKPMDAEDLIEQILAGLSEDYKPGVDAINGRDVPISYSDLHE